MVGERSVIMSSLVMRGIAEPSSTVARSRTQHRSSTARASFGIYTTHEEIDVLATALIRVREFFT